VSLTATNGQGSDTETKTNYITVQACANPPFISSISPASGQAGANVNIYGSNFSLTPLVFFNGVQAQVTFVSSRKNLITAKVPQGATSGPLWVEGPAGCKSNEKPFTVLP
jgi:PKD repeat protein